jgi:pimeloyl-ACP methyl ester carboxylesterase
MATFVLVHGAWGGAHGFRHVRRMLRAGGHEVTTPSLTGIGERVHLASSLVNLSTHVRDVVNHILYEDLTDIVLVGFSYGGFVITGALEHIAARIQHLVFLDAFVPQSGEAALSLAQGVGRMKIELGQNWQVIGPAREYDDPAEAAWMTARRTPHPIGCFTEAVYLSQPLESFSFTRTYIKATHSPETDNDAFWRAARQARASSAWQYFELATNHMVASNMPEETARVLAHVATQTPSMAQATLTDP